MSMRDRVREVLLDEARLIPKDQREGVLQFFLQKGVVQKEEVGL